MTVLVTGASGFIGRHVVAELLRRSISVRVACRQGGERQFPVDGVDVRYLSGAGAAANDWFDAVADCDTVIHLAARAHVLRDRDSDPARAFRLANVDFALACGEAASRAGVRRFIFMSSIGVHGDKSGAKPINPSSPIKPHTKYACSKAEAEQVLKNLVVGSSMKLIVVRPPLVYGLGAPGNFRVLVRSLACGLPLPFGSLTKNQRSFVSVENLTNLIVICLEHPAAVNQTFLVSDGEDLSTAELLRRLGMAMGRSARLFSVPVRLLAAVSRLVGKEDVFQSLSGSLQVDITKTREVLNWNPVLSVDEGLRSAVKRIL